MVDSPASPGLRAPLLPPLTHHAALAAFTTLHAGAGKPGGERQQKVAAAAAAEPACPTQCPDTAKTEARKLADQKFDFLLATFAVLLLLACCPLGLLVSVALVVADLLSQLVRARPWV